MLCLFSSATTIVDDVVAVKEVADTNVVNAVAVHVTVDASVMVVGAATYLTVAVDVAIDGVVEIVLLLLL